MVDLSTLYSALMLAVMKEPLETVALLATCYWYWVVFWCLLDGTHVLS